MSEYERYSRYRSTNVDWIPSIPDHWKFLALSRITRSRCDGPFGSGLKSRHYTATGVRVIRLQNIGAARFIGADVAFIDLSYYERELGDHSVLQNDLIIAGLGDRSNPVGRACVAPEGIAPAMVKADCFRFRLVTGQANPKYVAYQLTSTAKAAAVSATGATRSRLNLSATANRKLALPPLSEQLAIASFLDRETAKIDAFIQKKRRLIELLNEKRSALISHAVTKGLDPSVAMRESITRWLPSIPSEWSPVRLKYLCKHVADGPHFSPSYSTAGIMFISARNIRQDRWSFSDAKFVSESDYLEFCKRTKPVRGDVLYTKGGTTGIARVVDFDERFHVWVHVAVLKLRASKVDPFYLAYSLNSRACYAQAQIYTRGATNNDLGLTRMVNITLALPSLAEQKRIVKWLDVAAAEVSRLSHRVRTAISRLQEYRAALISAAVTGQIDVRGEV